MQKPYWVGNLKVDPTRNEITRPADVVSVQPKVMAVLNLLAEHQGQVVDHDKIMELVWPDVFVTPNTLQRCIAELRKVFADDSRKQQVIKTHPKVGYSLEISVDSEKRAQSRTNTKTNAWTWFVVLSPLLVIVAFSILYPESEPDYQHFSSKPLTASDNKEYYPGYSPDGSLLIFHRYEDICENHLWAKDLSSGSEYRLTERAGIYQEQSWLPDQESIYYSVQERCLQNTSLPPCWTIHSLNIQQAMSASQTGSPLFQCRPEKVSSPIQIDADTILFLTGDRPITLHAFSLSTRAERVFYRLENAVVESFAYSPQSKRIALISKTESGNKSLLELDTGWQLLSEQKIVLPEDVSVRHSLSVKYDSSGESLLFAASRGLYQLALSGEITYLGQPGHENIHKPAFHPDNNKIVFTVGNNDADVILADISSGDVAYQTIERSTAYDVNGLFRPNSDSVAFLSRRSGARQIWLFEDGKVNQLSQFEYDTRISGFGWSPDGERLAVVSDDRLYLLTGEAQQEVTTPVRVIEFHDWKSNAELLLTLQTDSGAQLAWLELQTDEITFLHSVSVNWAKHISDDTILFLDSNKYLYRFTEGSSEPQQITDQRLNSKRFVWSEHALWGIDDDLRVWRFDLDSQVLETVVQLHNKAWWLSDVREDKLLITSMESTTNQIFEASLD